MLVVRHLTGHNAQQSGVFIHHLLAPLLAAAVFGQTPPPNTFDASLRSGTARVRVVIRSRPFRASAHRVTGVENYTTRVDGRRVIGTDGGLPTEEIASIVFTCNGKRVPVGRWFYNDLYQPNLDPYYIKVRPARTPGDVIVRMSGSDGAGSYEVTWILRANGKHRRFVNAGLC
jgi:hypothetical protein